MGRWGWCDAQALIVRHARVEKLTVELPGLSTFQTAPVIVRISHLVVRASAAVVCGAHAHIDNTPSSQLHAARVSPPRGCPNSTPQLCEWFALRV
jgi:hypothetical protein